VLIIQLYLVEVSERMRFHNGCLLMPIFSVLNENRPSSLQFRGCSKLASEKVATSFVSDCVYRSVFSMSTESTPAEISRAS
jgi:hypothetical protein